MKTEVRDQIVALLAAEVEAYADNLDALEGQLLSSLREISEGTLQAVTAAKKGGTQAAGGSAPADERRGSSGTATKPS